MRRRFGATMVFVCWFAAGCRPAAPAVDGPQWVGKLISRFQEEPVGNPPQSVWRYEFKGRIVYYIPPQCCDQYSRLFDEEGKALCAPDGGMTGAGDGKCPDFFKERTREELIWRDPRKRGAH